MFSSTILPRQIEFNTQGKNFYFGLFFCFLKNIWKKSRIFLVILIHAMLWALKQQAVRFFRVDRTFFSNSFALALSLLTWDSATSALSLTSFSSYCCFLYLERYWLAWASCKNGKHRKWGCCYSIIIFSAMKWETCKWKGHKLSPKWNTLFQCKTHR